MMRTRLFSMAMLAVVLASTIARTEPVVAPLPRQMVDLTGYRTVDHAIAADPKEFSAISGGSLGLPGFLGVLVGEKHERTVIEAVAPDSPADVAGIKEGDVVLKCNNEPVVSVHNFRETLHNLTAGDKISLTISRNNSTLVISASAKPTSKPMTPPTGNGRKTIGVVLGSAVKDGGVKLDEVSPKGPSEKAGLKTGDVLLRMDGKEIDGAFAYREIINGKSVGDLIDVIALRGDKKIEAKVAVVTEESAPQRAGGWDDRLPRAFRRTSYKLAILGVEYSDVKHNPKITDADWEESMFSLGTYTGKSATGEKVHGSMNDYYKELSYGKFKVEGKFIGWVEASKKRLDYSSGSGTSNKEKTALLTEALGLYTKKNGENSLKDYDGIFFLYAGGRVETTRGGLYWPHRANVQFGGKSWPYFIVQEGGTRMTDISVFCHEFGHMLGLPDLYARPEQPGSEGVGVWCAMSNQIGGGRPQHFCAWSKEQLGWIKPTIIDPRVKQKLILAPIEDDPTQCFKIMLRPDGSEYYLLENRKKMGWDSQLPGEGLLVWRVFAGIRGQQQPVYLEESHGIEGARGPGSYLTSVPFPSAANNSFTPYTTPSSKSQLGGGLPVWITSIRRLPDGRITFHIGYEYQ
jgi:M6 family metalloprotease-like protein